MTVLAPLGVAGGAGDPGTGEPALGLPGARFDYGLLLATAAVLDDANTEAAAARKARGYPSGRAVRPLAR